MKVLGYCRVSTEEQSSEGVSLDAQAAKLRAYCGLYQLELVEVLSDVGTGKHTNRPALAKALERIAAGEVQGLVVAKLDRLTRSVGDLAALMTGVFDRAHFFSVADSIDTRTAAGRLVANVLASVAQWERETIVERTRDALRHKASRHERTGTVPYGFDLDASGPHNRRGRPLQLVTNPLEQAVARTIHAWRADGMTPGAIAGRLNESGIPTKQGRGVWRHTSVRRILSRPLPESSTP